MTNIKVTSMLKKIINIKGKLNVENGKYIPILVLLRTEIV